MKEWILNRQVKDPDDVIALDTETNSLDVFGNPEFKIVGIGLGHGDSAIYYHGSNMRGLLQFLKDEEIPLIAHNLFYDGAVVAKYLGSVRGEKPAGWLNWRYCTYGLLRFLTEGFTGQSYSLKTCMTELLLWKNTNEDGIDSWLLDHGYIQGPNGINPADDPDTRNEKIMRILKGKGEDKSYKPNKGLMYLCPPAILGEYCNLDTYATYQLYREILLPAIKKYGTSELETFLTDSWNMLIRNCIDNYAVGVNLDVERLKKYSISLAEDVQELDSQIYKAYRKEIKEVNNKLYHKFTKKTLPKIKKTKTAGVKLGAEPTKYTKDGRLSKTWITWELKRRRLGRIAKAGDPISSNYAKWRKRKRDLKKAQKLREDFKTGGVSYTYNPNSGEHKKEILYAGVPVQVIRKHQGPDWKQRGRLLVNDIPIDMTKSGSYPTGKAAILILGGKALLFDKYNKLVKKKQFVDSILNKVSRETGRYHPRFKVPGTNTLRLSGDGGINVQNQPKDEEYLRCWLPSREGHFIMSDDFKSLEPFVLTEGSRDSSMLSLYGPGAPANDVYIFTAAKIGGALGQPMLDLGYDPEAPTPEAIKACKAKVNKLRQCAKVITLQDDYGSGAYKKWVTLRIQGFNYTFEEVEEIQERLHTVYAGKKAFTEKLNKERIKNNGFILDMLGFPIAIDPKKEKDLTNKLIQRSGHLCLALLLAYITKEFWKQDVEYDWVVCDLHDDLIPSIHKKDIEKVKAICYNGINWLNDYLQPIAKLEAVPEFSDTLAGLKIENYEPEDEDLAELLDEINS